MARTSEEVKDELRLSDLALARELEGLVVRTPLEAWEVWLLRTLARVDRMMLRMTSILGWEVWESLALVLG